MGVKYLDDPSVTTTQTNAPFVLDSEARRPELERAWALTPEESTRLDAMKGQFESARNKMDERLGNYWTDYSSPSFWGVEKYKKAEADYDAYRESLAKARLARYHQTLWNPTQETAGPPIAQTPPQSVPVGSEIPRMPETGTAPAPWSPPANVTPWTPPAAEPESMASYWSRSPALAAAERGVQAGARAVGQQVQPIAQDVGRFAGRMADQWVGPVREAANIYNRNIIQPAIGFGNQVGQVASQAIDQAGQAIIPPALAASAWWQENITPPALPPRSSDYGPPLSGRGSPVTATPPPGAGPSPPPPAPAAPRTFTDKSTGIRYQYIGGGDPNQDRDPNNWRALP